MRRSPLEPRRSPFVGLGSIDRHDRVYPDDAVGGKAPILIDGSFVLKALALGARAS
jgi:hypothetical protein